MKFEILDVIAKERTVLEEQLLFLIQDFESKHFGSYIKEIKFEHLVNYGTGIKKTNSINVIVDNVEFDR
jgi:hypothetical protein